MSASEDGIVYALNASTGALLWSYTTGGTVWLPRPQWRTGWFMSGSNDDHCTGQSVCAERQHRRHAVEL